MPADIQITGLCKSYRDKKVLDNLSLTIKAGSITALMAPSGAGKTTLLRILMGLELSLIHIYYIPQPTKPSSLHPGRSRNHRGIPLFPQASED